MNQNGTAGIERGRISDQLAIGSETVISRGSGQKNTREGASSGGCGEEGDAYYSGLLPGHQILGILGNIDKRKNQRGFSQSSCTWTTGYGCRQSKRTQWNLWFKADTKSLCTMETFHSPLPVLALPPPFFPPITIATHVS